MLLNRAKIKPRQHILAVLLVTSLGIIRSESEAILQSLYSYTHYENMPIQIHVQVYIENFTTKNWKFSDKNSDIFHISANNIDCGYLLELPDWGSSNKYSQSIFFEQK